MPPMHFPARLQFGLAALVLVAALVLGGGQGTLGDSAVQLAALVLMAVCFWRHALDEDARLPGAAALAVVVLAIPVLQLLPLPESLWLLPDARDTLHSELAVANLEPTARVSLVPASTERALFWLLPAVALFLASLQLSSGSRQRLLALVVAMAAVSVVLGLAQLFGGNESPLRFYDITNAGASVGFFANRNHLASLLAVSLPLVVVGTMAWYQRREAFDARTTLGVAAGIGLVALLILGIAIARSRAGLLLGMLGLLLSLPLVLRMRRRRGTRRALTLALALGFTLVMQFALFGILQRLEQDPLEDARFQILPVAMQAAGEHSPWGAGLGGFQRAFEARDPAPGTAYINHAHNDWLELWIDAGFLGLSVAALALAWLIIATWRAWLRAGRGASAAQSAPVLVSALALLLLGLHSLGDYPLRTTALLAIAGLLAGVLLAGRANPGKKPREIHLPPEPDGARLGGLFNS